MSQRNTLVDWARLALAFNVAWYHFKDWHHLPAPFPGRFCVPAFLAISGYYVLQSYGRSTLKEFVLKRIARIVPAFLVCLLLFWVGSGSKGLLLSLESYATLGLADVSAPGYHLWSLSTEEIIYAFLVVASMRGFYRSKRASVYAFLISMPLCVGIFDFYPMGNFYRISEVIPAFFAGNVAYLYRDKPIGKWAWVGLPLVIGGLALNFEPWSLDMGFATTVGGAMLGAGVLLLSRKEKAGIRFKNPIPDISYGVYLYHPAVFLLLHNLSPALFLLAFVAWCLLSWFAIERPALRAVRHFSKSTIRDNELITVDRQPGPELI